jgi:hypothetical protein
MPPVFFECLHARSARWCSSIAMAAVLAATPLGGHAAGLTEAQEATERSAIINVFNWSLIAFDNGDRTAFLSVFSEDGTFNVKHSDPNRQVSMTKAEMLSRWSGQGSSSAANAAAPAVSQHLTGTLAVVFTDSTHATLYGYEARLLLPQGVREGPVTPAGMGSYEVKLVKSNGKWLFSSYTLVHAGVAKAPLAPL